MAPQNDSFQVGAFVYTRIRAVEQANFRIHHEGGTNDVEAIQRQLFPME